jgi:hypothetical protein
MMLSKASMSTIRIPVVLFGLLSPFSPATAQNQAVPQVRKNFDECFYHSIGGQIKQGQTADINMMSELAFRACATEEQAIAAYLNAYGNNPALTSATIIKIKLALKAAARNIADNPAKYAK